MRLFTLLSVSILLAGCSSSTIDNNYPISDEHSTTNFYVPNYVFNSDYQDSININSLEDNLKLLKAFNNDNAFIDFINKNKSMDSEYYSYFYNYNLLIKKIKEQEIEKEKEKEKEKENNKKFNTKKSIEFQSINTTNSKTDEQHSNNSMNNDSIISNPKIDEKTIKKQKEEKEHLKKERALKEKNKIQSYTDNYNIIKEDIDNHFLILKAHCHEEDAYLIPEDNDNFKEYIFKYSSEKTIYKNSPEFSDFVYSFYKKDIELCLHIFENITN